MNAYVLHIHIGVLVLSSIMLLIEPIVQLQTVVHNGRKELLELSQKIGIRQLLLLLFLFFLPLLLLHPLLLLICIETKINCIVYNLSVPVNNIY